MAKVPSDTYTPTTADIANAIGDWAFHTGHPNAEDRPELLVDDGETMLARWLIAHDASVAAKAWDEGFDVGYDRVLVERASQPGALDLRDNPYRARLSSGGEG